jgi:hypothetical protein
MDERALEKKLKDKNYIVALMTSNIGSTKEEKDLETLLVSQGLEKETSKSRLIAPCDSCLFYAPNYAKLELSEKELAPYLEKNLICQGLYLKPFLDTNSKIIFRTEGTCIGYRNLTRAIVSE